MKRSILEAYLRCESATSRKVIWTGFWVPTVLSQGVGAAGCQFRRVRQRRSLSPVTCLRPSAAAGWLPAPADRRVGGCLVWPGWVRPGTGCVPPVGPGSPFRLIPEANVLAQSRPGSPKPPRSSQTDRPAAVQQARPAPGGLPRPVPVRGQATQPSGVQGFGWRWSKAKRGGGGGGGEVLMQSPAARGRVPAGPGRSSGEKGRSHVGRGDARPRGTVSGAAPCVQRSPGGIEFTRPRSGLRDSDPAGRR